MAPRCSGGAEATRRAPRCSIGSIGICPSETSEIAPYLYRMHPLKHIATPVVPYETHGAARGGSIAGDRRVLSAPGDRAHRYGSHLGRLVVRGRGVRATERRNARAGGSAVQAELRRRRFVD